MGVRSKHQGHSDRTKLFRYTHGRNVEQGKNSTLTPFPASFTAMIIALQSWKVRGGLFTNCDIVYCFIFWRSVKSLAESLISFVSLSKADVYLTSSTSFQMALIIGMATKHHFMRPYCSTNYQLMFSLYPYLTYDRKSKILPVNSLILRSFPVEISLTYGRKARNVIRFGSPLIHQDLNFGPGYKQDNGWCVSLLISEKEVVEQIETGRR